LLTTRLAIKNNLNEIIILLLNVIVVTVVVLFFSEILPKITAVKNSRKLAISLSLPLTFFYYLFYPVTLMFFLIIQIVSNILGIDKNKFELTDEELKALVDIGEEKGALRKDEKEMIHSILEMSDTMAREIMVPRTDIVCLEQSSTLNQVMSIVKDKVHSRIPVYAKRLDNIIGILYLKDLLPYIRKRTIEKFDMTKLLHPVHYVPEQKRINELLREFQKQKIHMAIVVDEYGGTSGLVTLEDVIEEIVGEIQDEYDQEAPEFLKLNDKTYVVAGGMAIDDLNEELEFKLPAEEGTDTLAGFLLGQFGFVPRAKEKITWNGYDFIIEKSTKKRIQQVRIILRDK
jgi:putative hemolysin